MRALAGSLMLIAARARRRPSRWLLAALGIALAVAFAAGIASESVIAGDQAARSELAGLSPLDRTVRITWQGPLTSGVADRVRAMLRGLTPSAQTEVAVLNPVRLDGVVVRPVAIAPLDRWLRGARLGPCRPAGCPVLLAGGGTVPPTLSAAGVKFEVVGSEPLRSAVPLAFDPATGGQGPVLVSGDPSGLDALPGLSGVYRTQNWLASLATAHLHSWQLASIEGRLARLQAELGAAAGQLSITAPFDGLDAARAQSSAAPQRLLLVGGGAVAALILFVVLAGGGLRSEQRLELARLRAQGARSWQSVAFVAGEAAWISTIAVLVGAGLGVLASVVLASGAGEPVAAVLSHGVIRPLALIALLGGWLAAVLILMGVSFANSNRLTDLLAVAALSALIVGVSEGTSSGRVWTLLLAPLCCLAGAVILFRVAEPGLRMLERLAREGPVQVRLALVGLARSPVMPALAIAFVAVSVGLGGFALAYRSTLLRGTADQAADRVPLDAVIAPGTNFVTPLELAPLERWRALSGGSVLPVLSTQATYPDGSATVTIPSLGVPAGGLRLIHGWRSSYSSTPLAELGKRLAPVGPVRNPGPSLVRGARWLSVDVRSPGLAVVVTAELRAATGEVQPLALGAAGRGLTVLRARLPAGTWELEAIELTEPTGLEATNGHQNAENPAATTQFATTVTLGSLSEVTGSGRVLKRAPLGSWRGVGAATALRSQPGAFRFQADGAPGVIRPAQPSDTNPIPVLVDPTTAAAAGPGGRIAMTIDELPVAVRVVGVIDRFPTIPPGSGGVLVADQASLSAALDAQLPGQGQPDRLWVACAHPAALRAALRGPSLSQLSSLFRSDLERSGRASPIARGVLRALLAAVALTGVLALVGMVLALIGGLRDRSVERDLEEQGLGPKALRSDLRARFTFAGVLGAIGGVVIAVLETRLAVASVSASLGNAHPQPPLVTVVPWGELAAWTLGAMLVLALAGWVVTWSLVGEGGERTSGSRRSGSSGQPPGVPSVPLQGAASR